MKDIILTGPKHSGKTRAGKALASLCSCEFTDLDELITQRTGKSARQLYTEGKEIFQKAETEAVESLASTADNAADNSAANSSGDEQLRIVAAGGGMIDNQDAVAIIKKLNAVVIYLSIDAASAWERIARSPGGLPPFLQTENPQETHRALHERRAAAYSQMADIVIEAEGKQSEKIAAEIISKINLS